MESDASSGDSSLSDDSFKPYARKIYGDLQAGKLRTRASNGQFACPWCTGKVKQSWNINDLLQHANGVAHGAAHRKEKEKASHLALFWFLQPDLVLRPDPDAPPQDEGLQIEFNAMSTMLAQRSQEKEELLKKVAGMEHLNQMLSARVRELSHELHTGRKTLLMVWRTMGCSDVNTEIGLKVMGELDEKVFQEYLKHTGHIDAIERGTSGCAFWQEKLRRGKWHPFKSTVAGEEVIDHEDEALRRLKNEWGFLVYDEVVAALKELQVYGECDVGDSPVREFWNLKESRKATLQEVIDHLISFIASNKRKRVA